MMKKKVVEEKWTASKLIKFERKIALLFEQGLIDCPIHLCGGNEDMLIRLFEGITKEDYVFVGHRNHYHYLLKGGSARSLQAEICGTRFGPSRGCGRSMHFSDHRLHFYTTGIVAGLCAPAVGVALALKKEKAEAQVWCFIGDGGEDSGHFMEASRFAVARRLPLTFIVEDNDRAVESTKQERWHNYPQFNSPNVLRYTYKRTYPHVGVGKHVSM